MNRYDEEYKAKFAELLKKYGSATKIPYEEHHYISDLLRARYILDKCNDDNRISTLSQYGVSQAIIKELTGVQDISSGRKEKRSDKYSKILSWCRNNVGTETTVYEIAELGEVSYATANNFVKDRIDLFKKVKKGQYIVRDPEAERVAEKQSVSTDK